MKPLKFLLTFFVCFVIPVIGFTQAYNNLFFQVNHGGYAVTIKIPEEKTYRTYSVRLNPNVGIFVTPNFVAGLQGEYNFYWDNRNTEFPVLWGGGLFTNHYLGVWEHSETFERKDKADKTILLRVYPKICFRASMLNGYFDSYKNFHPSFSDVLMLGFHPGIEIGLVKTKLFDLRFDISKGFVYYPIRPVEANRKLRFAAMGAINFLF